MRNLFSRSHSILPPLLFAGSEEKAGQGLTFFSKLFLATILLVACSEFRTLASEQPTVATENLGPRVEIDLLDYPPGATAKISGCGFQVLQIDGTRRSSRITGGAS